MCLCLIVCVRVCACSHFAEWIFQSDEIFSPWEWLYVYELILFPWFMDYEQWILLQKKIPIPKNYEFFLQKLKRFFWFILSWCNLFSWKIFFVWPMIADFDFEFVFLINEQFGVKRVHVRSKKKETCECIFCTFVFLSPSIVFIFIHLYIYGFLIIFCLPHSSHYKHVYGNFSLPIFL